MTTEKFTERFEAFICEGDTISCEIKVFKITARIVSDYCPDAPDERDNDFWPYLDDEMEQAKLQAAAEEVMRAWLNGEWFYCGIVLSVSLEGVTLDDSAASVWGIKANYSDSDNSNLNAYANDLLDEALKSGLTIAKHLREAA